MDPNYIVSNDLAKSLMPDWTPEDWFHWPPDIFAFTSILLQATGVYRYAVSPHHETNKRLLSDLKGEERNARLNEVYRHWYRWILGVEPELPEALKNCKQILLESDSKLSAKPNTVDFKTCEALLDLHTMADVACANFGLMTATHEGRMCAIYFLANYLLSVTGSLSRLPSHHGVVLPKMRTPQKGLTIRSFSHHLTFHRSEAKVLWRSIPWNDASKTNKTINLLAVPLPYELNLEDFRAVDAPLPSSEAKGFRYFDFEPSEQFEPERIIGLLQEAQKEVGQVHLLVFPELALTEENLEDLQSALQESLSADEIPMIITGIRGRSNGMGKNKVRLSVYFARKWYNLGQEKHHRWRLDKSQIEQYSLSRILDPGTNWWEAIDIGSRQLTFLVPNTWLTLCPLICEDLAQLEPISQLIRGVGPNFVIAILMDGPQLPQRWPARYVGVLADDPGSAVLTLTSLGMAARCGTPGMPESRVIALWKGQDSPWAPIELSNNSKAVLLNISAESREEFTADGRTDYGAAASLRLRETHRLRDSHSSTFDKHRIESSNPEDLVELTVFSFLTDAIIDAPSILITEFRARVTRSDQKAQSLPCIDAIKPFDSIWSRIEGELRREKFEAKKQGKPWTKQSFDEIVDKLCKFIASFNGPLDKLLLMAGESQAERNKKIKAAQNPLKKLQRWANIADAAINGINRSITAKARTTEAREQLRRDQVLYGSVLWAIFNRLDQRKDRLTNDPSECPKECQKEYNDLLEKVTLALSRF
ncbi:MAG TPA: hypothetical protein VE980_12365 [Pyrinomonadaceae bacterium]|nr:hypothetical protein [Pyrinomonadaceae bacterium]